MKINLGFFTPVVIVLAIYVPAVQAQANLTFSGGGGTPITITLQQSVVYTINNTNCSSTSLLPFVFDEAGDPFGTSARDVTGMITFSINGGSPQPIHRTNSGGNNADITTNDLYLFNYPSEIQLFPGDIVILNAGTVTTTNSSLPGKPAPANGSFTTFITNLFGVRCSSNGVAMGTTAASVSVSGRVLTNSRRGLSNAVVYLTDSEGDTRTARTNSFGYYRFQDVQAGQSVTVTVASKRYQFAPQVLNINEEMSGVNFLAEQ